MVYEICSNQQFASASINCYIVLSVCNRTCHEILYLIMLISMYIQVLVSAGLLNPAHTLHIAKFGPNGKEIGEKFLSGCNS